MQEAFLAEAFTGGSACTQLKNEQNRHQRQIVDINWCINPVASTNEFKLG